MTQFWAYLLPICYQLQSTLVSHTRPFSDFRDAHASVRLPPHRDPVEPRSRVQARTKSVAARLIGSYAPNIKVLTYFEPVNAIRNLAVRTRLLDAWTEVGVSQRDAGSIPARRIDNLPSRDSTVRVDPVAPSPTVCGGRVGDLLALPV
ncbi:MAG TPA: hypothetical protein VNZ03_00370 [Terriglobales bacterium]|nr:hypothetical protein [Terriglobales bacterium]